MMSAFVQELKPFIVDSNVTVYFYFSLGFYFYSASYFAFEKIKKGQSMRTCDVGLI